MDVEHALKRIALATLAMGCMASGPVQAGQSEAEKEAAKQTSRQISDAIARRIADAVAQETSSVAADAGDPARANLLFSGWFSGSYTNLTEGDRAAAGSDSDTDVWLGTVGLDRRMGPHWFAGLSGTLSYADSEATTRAGGLTRTEVEVDGITISPYASLLFTKEIFTTLRLAYAYSETDQSTSGAAQANGDNSSDAYTAELSLNTVHRIERWQVKSRLSGAFTHTELDLDRNLFAVNGVTAGFTPDDSIDSHQLVADGELGYRVVPSTLVYGGLQYEYSANEESSRSNQEDRDTIYARLGFSHDPNPLFTVGAQVQSSFENDFSESLAGYVNLRARF